MKYYHFKSRFFALVIICIVNAASVHAQINLSSMDTISQDVAQQRRAKFHGANKPIAVTYDAQQLKDILQTCIDNEIYDVQFVFATIRLEDTDKYIARLKKHGKKTDQVNGNNLRDKPTIILRVPRSAFNLALNQDPQNNDLVKKLSSGGPKLLTETSVNIPYASGYLYFDIGSICPPPEGCD